LTFRRHSNGAVQHIDVPVVPIMPAEAFRSALRDSVRVIEQDGHRIGYLHIWSTNDEPAFRNALDRLDPSKVRMPAPLDSLIVDVRGRVGGNVAVAAKVLEILDRKLYLGNWDTVTRGFPNVRPKQAMNPEFRGRSALLIDDHTRSAAELVAFGFKRSGLGPLFGTPTAGAVSSGMLFTMPGDLLLYVAIAGHRHDGELLEGVGVAPDRIVERPLPYAAGADPVLDAAVAHLAKAGAP
jgi:carboxyl-terminal processing protease